VSTMADCSTHADQKQSNSCRRTYCGCMVRRKSWWLPIRECDGYCQRQKVDITGHELSIGWPKKLHICTCLMLNWYSFVKSQPNFIIFGKGPAPNRAPKARAPAGGLGACSPWKFWKIRCDFLQSGIYFWDQNGLGYHSKLGLCRTKKQ